LGIALGGIVFFTLIMFGILALLINKAVEAEVKVAEIKIN
jgi:hypothetical protein